VAARRLRVVSWNVHGCVGSDGRFRLERTADVLTALAGDLVLLQEVGDNRGIHPPIDQASGLANALGLVSAVAITLKTSFHGYGNATLSRLPILEPETLDLSVPGREPRLALRVDLDCGAERLRCVNVHLGLGASERREQLARLLPLASAGAPLVIGGDFNDFPPGPVSLSFRHLLLDAGARRTERRTFPSWLPLLRLDRIYCSPELTCVHAFVDRSGAARRASDHLPVVADLEVRTGNRQPATGNWQCPDPDPI
jgi:endonuclease/exonuclease/phosphatase family metal-dependent hydrolase